MHRSKYNLRIIHKKVRWKSKIDFKFFNPIVFAGSMNTDIFFNYVITNVFHNIIKWEKVRGVF